MIDLVTMLSQPKLVCWSYELIEWLIEWIIQPRYCNSLGYRASEKKRREITQICYTQVYGIAEALDYCAQKKEEICQCSIPFCKSWWTKSLHNGPLLNQWSLTESDSTELCYSNVQSSCALLGHLVGTLIVAGRPQSVLVRSMWRFSFWGTGWLRSTLCYSKLPAILAQVFFLFMLMVHWWYICEL